MKKNKLFRLIDDYTTEKTFKIIYKIDSLNVVNYTKILDFSSTLISFSYKKTSYYVEGENLVISKMMEDEILITGDIRKISFM